MTGFTLTITDEVPQGLKLDLPKKVNLTRLARQTGYSLSHLSRVFKGQTTPSVECLGALSTHLGVSMDELKVAIDEGKITCLS